MIPRDWPLALYMEGAFGLDYGKMGYGVLRYSQNQIAGILDTTHAGKSVGDFFEDPAMRPETPIVASLEELTARGAKVLVLGIAPSGGLLPAEWAKDLDRAVELGLSIVNGLHDPLRPRYEGKLSPGQFVWDIRQEPEGLAPATGRAQTLSNRRLLMIGTDMAIGKMTAGLEIRRELLERGVKSEFVATGQIGITLTGRGVPLDAVRVDYASGSIEREVMNCADAEVVIIEGQGSLVHPGSTANLPLLRGSMPTHLVLCHKMGQTHLRRIPDIRIPPLPDLLRQYEELASMGGIFPRPKSVGIALNTSGFSVEEASDAKQKIADETGLVVEDPVRDGAKLLASAVMA
jgi:uncharacterized NAD-dependent epimerase/dehydratase family protein